jgi:hypothetical protein
MNSLDDKGFGEEDPKIWIDIQPLINGQLLVWYYEDDIIKTVIL